MLAPTKPPHPECGYQAEARGRPVLARLPGPGTAASASGESTNHSEAARLAEPGAGRGEVTAWSGTGGWRLCSTAAQQPRCLVTIEVSALPLATCPLHLVMKGAGAGAGVSTLRD